jgi:hypothetical protein
LKNWATPSTKKELDAIYEEFLVLADSKKEIIDEDLKIARRCQCPGYQTKPPPA